MATRQVKLTKEQAQKFYQEYTTQKLKRMDAGGPADYVVWKNQIEAYLQEAADGANWSNTEIRNANRRLARSATMPGEQIMSDKQAKLFSRYMATHSDTRQDFAAEYGISETEAPRFAREHPGTVFAFLS